MSGLFMNQQMPAVPIPPSAPSLNSEAVLQAAKDETRRRTNASGRASTFLTSPQSQRTADENQQRYLGGI